MKIKKISNWKHKPKFLKIKLLKTQTYKNSQNFKKLKIENIEYRLKKILHIIYHFHTNNKTILFSGIPINSYKQIKTLLIGTKHILIPENLWINGALTNQHTILKHLLQIKNNNKNHTQILFQLQKKADLIVVLNQQNNKTILDESYISKTPVICLNSDLTPENYKPTYKVPGNFNFTNKKINNSFFYSILKATLKKGKKNQQKIRTVRPKHNSKNINKKFIK